MLQILKAKESSPSVLYIRNMVCQRCIATVQRILEEDGIAYRSIELGKIELEEQPTQQSIQQLNKKLEASGFEIIDDRKKVIVNKIRQLLIALPDHLELQGRKKLSVYITGHLHYEYSYLSDLFSSIEGITIEQYFLNQRIEKVKEYLAYNEMTLSEIADKLGFSSVHHLSAQFRKMTGMTPTHFRSLTTHSRKGREEI